MDIRVQCRGYVDMLGFNYIKCENVKGKLCRICPKKCGASYKKNSPSKSSLMTLLRCVAVLASVEAPPFFSFFHFALFETSITFIAASVLALACVMFVFISVSLLENKSCGVSVTLE